MEYKKYRDKICTMLDQLFEKPDLSIAEVKNATEAFELLHKIDEVQRGESMRDQFGESYGHYYPEYYGSQGRFTGGPHPDLNYGDSYGRQMRSTVTGRYMDNDLGKYGHSIKDRMVARLEDMMDQAKNKYEQDEIKEEIRRIRMNETM